MAHEKMGLRLMYKNRLMDALRDFKAGIGYGYPFCCVLSYCIRRFFGDSCEQQRKPIFRLDGREYIPCYIHERFRNFLVNRQVERFLVNGGKVLHLGPSDSIEIRFNGSVLMRAYFPDCFGHRGLMYYKVVIS